MKLMALLILAIALGLVSCQDSSPEPTRPSKPIESIQAPLERIPIRQEVIAGLVPDNKPVLQQVEATKNDVQEAKSGVDKTQEQINKLQTDLQDQKNKTKEAQSEADKSFRAKLNWIKLACISGIGISIALCFFVSKKFIALGISCGCMLFAILIFDFLAKIAVPVFCGVMGILTLALLYEKFVKHKTISELWNSTPDEVKLSPTVEKVTQGLNMK